MGGGEQPSTTTQTNKVELSPEQKKLFEYMMPSIQKYASSDLKLYPNSTIANFTGLEKDAQNKSVAAANGEGTALAKDSANLQHFLLDPGILSPDSNPYLKQAGDAVAQQSTNNLLENILPQVRSGATVAGGQYSGGSTREAMGEGLAIGKTSQGISQSLAQMYNDAYQNGLKTLTTSQALTPSVQSSLLFGPQVEAAVGQQQRAMNQAKLEEAASRFQLSQSLPLMKAQDILSIMTGMPGSTGVSTVTGAQPQTSAFGQGLGGAAAGAGLASTLFPTMAAAGPAGAGLGLLAALMMR